MEDVAGLKSKVQGMITSGAEQLKAVKKPTFNPELNYSWKADEILELKGLEFEFINNVINTIFTKDLPPSQMYASLYETTKVLAEILKRNVENGKIVEAEKE